MSGAEEASAQAACLAFANSTAQEVRPISTTQQIYDENGKAVLQIDGGAVGEKAALILSKKTTLLPGHVDQLERSINAVMEFSPRLAELAEFKGKQLYGKTSAKSEIQNIGCTITQLAWH